MEALCFQPLVEDKGMAVEGRRGKRSGEGAAMEAPSPVASTTDEETEEESEPEPPVIVRRKVSFADAFGLNLVSVKEFDNVEVTEAEVSPSPEGGPVLPLPELYMTCLFTVPSTPEELDLRLQAQMVELESIEFLQGTTTLRGIIRVANLCYTKFVYARLSLDRWSSYFDLLAEYVPGSSDTKTDRFAFMYTLVPPFGRGGTRVEFCLRYETSVGTFWANNRDMNYVLFCHQRGQAKERGGPQAAEEEEEEESAGYRRKRSCLKAKRRGSAQDRSKDIVTSNKATKQAETQATFKAGEGDSKRHKRSVCSRRDPDRATREACAKDYVSQRRQRIPTAYSPDPLSQPLPAPLMGPASFLHERQKKHSNEVLTYHQIPLLTLDWNSDKQQEWENSDTDDMWTRGGKAALRKGAENRPPGNDMWESLLNGTDENTDKGVCEVWQAFLNGPGSKDHSAVPESEWLQTAASVSPSNHERPQNRYASRGEGFQEFQVGMDTPTALHAHASAACQLLSATRETQPADVASNADDHQPAQGCGRSTRDDNAVTRDASQRSPTKSVTDTPQEFSLKGATPVSEGSVDSSTKCHKHAIWEREGEEIIGEAVAMGEDEPFTLHIADLVTSSRESKTTDMTAVPESQNARTVDRISQGAGLHQGLSSGGEKDVTGTAHKATDDTLAFKETIRQGTKGGEGFVACTSRRAAEEETVTSRIGNKESTEVELFRPLEMEACEISQSYADEMEREEFRTNQNEANERETGPARPHAHEFGPKQICGGDSVLKSETGGRVLVANQTEEERCPSGIVGPLQETEPSPQTAHTGHSSAKMKASQSDHDRIRPFTADKCTPNPAEAVKPRWTHSQEEDGSAITPEEITVKENVAQKDTLTEAQRQREPLKRTEEYTSQRDEDEKASVGKLKMEAMAALTGPWERRKDALAELEEQELSAEVERHQPVEREILSEGTKGPIAAENAVAREPMQSGLQATLVGRFAEDLVRGVCGEVLAGISDVTRDRRVRAEEGLNDALDSAAFSLSFSAGPHLGLGQVPASRINGHARKGKSQSATAAGQTPSPSESQAAFNSGAHLSRGPTTALATQCRPPLTTSAPAPSSGRNQQDCHKIRQQAGGHTEAQKERFNQSAHPSHKHPSSSSETLKESSGLLRCSILSGFSHITRLLIWALLLVGSFVLAFLGDLPAFVALYILSLCYWWYRWRRRQAAANKAMAG